jgi:hypothetical protein
MAGEAGRGLGLRQRPGAQKELARTNQRPAPLSLSRALILRWHRIEPMRISAMLSGRAGDETEGRLYPGLFVYGPPASQVAGGSSPQSDGVDVDDRGLIYLADRIILELRR